MRKLYFLLLFFIPCSIFAQPYFNDGATWYYGMWPFDTTSYIKIEKTGEAWMGGKLCDELKFSEFNFSNSQQPYVYYHYTYHSGDTVMIYKVYNSTFGMLYDFSAQTGDTLSCSYCVDRYVIDSTDQLALPTTMLKEFHTHVGIQKFEIYEKIGHTGYFFPWFNMSNPMSPGWQLRCYQDNEGLYLHTGKSESCDDGNAAHEETEIQFMVAPYGVSVISNSIKAGTEVTIYDARGRLVAQKIATQNNTCYVELQQDSHALYFSTIRNGTELISGKFMLANPWY